MRAPRWRQVARQNAICWPPLGNLKSAVLTPVLPTGVAQTARFIDDLPLVGPGPWHCSGALLDLSANWRQPTAKAAGTLTCQSGHPPQKLYQASVHSLLITNLAARRVDGLPRKRLGRASPQPPPRSSPCSFMLLVPAAPFHSLPPRLPRTPLGSRSA